MFNIIRYFLVTILFTSMGFGFIVGNWKFDDNKYSYEHDIANAVRDSSGNKIHGHTINHAGRKVTLTDNVPNHIGGTSVYFPNEWRNGQGEIFIGHNKKMLLDSGKISFWFQIEDFIKGKGQKGQKGAYTKALLSKDATQTRDSGDLTFYLTDYQHQIRSFDQCSFQYFQDIHLLQNHKLF